MENPAEGDVKSPQVGETAVARNAGAAKREQTVVLQDADGGGERVVEVSKLTPADRKLLVKGVLASEDQDQEQFLTELRDRLDRAGIEPTTAEVRYENLTIEASAYVGGRALPTVLNSYLNFIEGALLRLHLLRGSKKPFVILENMSGVIHPGRMTLLLGPPGSGKSTLLQALAGKFHHSGTLEVGGNITYNGHSFDKFVPVRTASYVTQSDTHLAELTVRETFDFSARCQGPGSRPNMLQRLLEREGAQGKQHSAANSYLQADTASGQRNAVITDYVIRILGLDVCADIPVGSEMIRGISGGQKKRVTTGEMLVGPQQVLFMDEISTGLDSSTTFQIVKCLRDFTHLRSGTVLMALLQPAPEVYDLFDDVLLMSEGRTIFHGPKEDVVDFFNGVGFRCPPRKGIPDFLQEVSSPKDQQQYWIREGPWKYVPGDTFVEAYGRHRTGQDMAAHLAQPFDQAKHKPESLVTTKFALNGLPALKATLNRELILMSRTFFVYIFKAVQMGIVGVVVATMYLRTHIHSHTILDANLVSGLLFFSLIQSIFAGIAEMTFTIERLPTFFKHRDNNFFPTWAFVIPTSLTRLPASLLEATVYTVIVYFAAPLSIDAGRFFIFLLILFLLHNMAITLFRMVGALTRNIVIANALGSLTMLLILMMGGFVIPKQNVHPWVVWIFWADPLQYAQRGFEVSQMTSELWQSTVLPGGLPLGNQELNIRGFSNHFWWVWIAVAALIFANVIFHVILLAAAQFLGPYGGAANIQSEESLAQREYAKHGGEGYTNVSVQMDEKEKSRRQLQLQKLNEASRRQTGSRKSLDGQSRRISDRALQKERRTSDKALQREHKSSRDLAASRKAVMESGDDLLHKGMANGNGDVRSIKVAPMDGSDGMADDVPVTSFKESQVDTGMTLPFQPMTLTFTDMHYFVKCPPEMAGKGLPQVGQKNGKEMLELLQGISGAFRPGILTCLMGVSGAGKTTLMDVLAGRKTGGLIEGDIRLNGHPKEQSSFARVSGYVEQFDIHSPRTTVREALQFSADLRFNGHPGRAALRAFVDEVMDLVELHPNRNSLVGVPGIEGLSVEQRKRLTIAVELVANPSIVFMDEPTSGLDARAAAIVMRTVRNIVNTGRTIVCTIHQPSIDIFESFDELLLLKSGGRTIYAGNLGQNSMDLVKYFQNVEGAGSLPAGLNPATWMLQVTTPGNAARLGVDFADYYEASALRERMDSIIATSSQPHPDQPPLSFEAPYAQGIMAQYVICMRKFFITFWRNPEYNQTRFSFSIAVALFFGACFWALGGRSDNETAIYSTLGALLVASLFLGILNSIFVQPVIASERQVFYRERAAGMYSVFPWYLGMATVEAGYLVLQTVLYVVIVYWMAGFISKPEQFFWFLFFNLLTLMYFTYYGVAAVACTPNLLVAAILSGSFYGLMNLAAGFTIPRPNIPGWWLWLYYINPVTWTLYGLVGSNLGEQTNNLTLNSGEITNVPDFLYNTFHYKHDMIGYVVLILFAFVAAFWVAGWAAFRYLNFNVR